MDTNSPPDVHIARWDEEIDLVTATIELDERTILIAVGRGLELRHPRTNLLVDLRRLTAKSYAEIRPAGDRAGLEPPFDGVVVRPKRDAGAIFGADRLDDAENLRPRRSTTSSSSRHARAIAAGSSSPQERDRRRLSLDPRRTHRAARLQLLVSTPHGDLL
jgi:hypothetical protein